MSWNDDDFYDASFGVGRSRRYHAFMREFYQRIADGVIAVQALSGASAFVALLPQNANPIVAKVLTGFVAISATLDLVLRFSDKARLHDELCGRFTELAACITEWPADAAHLTRAKAERIRLEAKEPTERRLIDLKAQNDECSARGVAQDRLIPLDFWQRSVFGYIFTFGEHNLRRRIADRDRSS